MRQQYYLSGNSKANFNYLLPLPFFLGSSSTRRTPTPTPTPTPCPPPEPPGCPAPTRVPAPTSAPLRPLVAPRKSRTPTRRNGAARATGPPLRSGGSGTCHKKKIVFSCCYCCYRNLPDLGNACSTWLLSALANATATLPSPSSHRSRPDPPRMSPASFLARRIQAPRADRGSGGSFLSSSSTTAMVTWAWKRKKISHFN